MNYPILEYDPTRTAFVEPAKVIRRRDVPEHCVISFFGEVIDKVAAEYKAREIVENRWEDGPHPLYETNYHGRRLAFYHPGVGAPLAGSLLEEVIAFGCRKFIACGGCGVLEKELALGELVVVNAAVRDEGFSYHYLPPSREVSANAAAVDAIVRELEKQEAPYRVGKTWTTDAPYRETQEKITRRRAEGCLTVEMEAAGMMAVAEFRQVILGQVLYSGDDLSGEEWEHRGWQRQAEIRQQLFWLCADACLAL